MVRRDIIATRTVVHAHLRLPAPEDHDNFSASDLSYEQHKARAFHFCVTPPNVFHLAAAQLF